MIIYKITNKINGMAYIGQTVQKLRYRWKKHISATGGCPRLVAAIQKYGSDSFWVEVIDTASTRDELNALEMYYIEILGTKRNGYNLTAGGSGQPIRRPNPNNPSLFKKGHKGFPNITSFKPGIKPVNSIKIVDTNGIVYDSVAAATRATGHCKKYIRNHPELFKKVS